MTSEQWRNRVKKAVSAGRARSNLTARIWASAVALVVTKPYRPNEDFHPDLRKLINEVFALRTVAEVACHEADINFNRLLKQCRRAIQKADAS